MDIMFDATSYNTESENETLSTTNSTNDSKEKLPKIKLTNKQEFPKPDLSKYNEDVTLPTLRPRRKRSSTNTCVCM